MSDERLEIVVESEASQASAEMEKLIEQFDRLGSKLDKLTTTLQGSSSSISRNVKNVGKSVKSESQNIIKSLAKISATIYTLKRTFQGLAKSIKSAMDYQETVHLFSTVFTRLGRRAGEDFYEGFFDRINEFQSKFIRLGLDPQALMNYQAVFAQMSDSMGVLPKTAYAISESFTALGADLSSLFNLPIEDAMLKLQAGLSGQIRPLRQLGIDISKTTLMEEARRRGITKSIEVMTASEKVQLRYLAIMRQTMVAHGDMAKTIMSPANSLRVLNQQLKMAGRAIGSIFLPIVQKLLPYLTAVAIVIQRIASFIAGLFGYELPKLHEVVTFDYDDGIIGDWDEEQDNIGETGKKLKKLKSILMGFDEINVLPDQSDTSSGTSGMGVGASFDLSDEILKVNEEYQKMIDEVLANTEYIAEQIADAMMKPFLVLKAVIIEVAELMKTLLIPTIKGIEETFKLINFENIGTNFKRVMENLAEISKIGLEHLYPIFQAGGEMLGTFLKYRIAVVGNYFDPLVEGFTNFTENFKPNILAWIEETSSTIINGFKNLESVFDTIGTLWLESIEEYKPRIIEATEDTFTNISKTIGLVITVITDTFEILSGKVKEFVDEHEEKIGNFMDSIHDIFLDVWELINKIWEDTLNALSDFWNNWGKDIVASVGDILSDIGGWFLYLWEELVKPVWDYMLKWLNELWDDTFKDIVKLLLEAIGKIGETIKFLWDNIFQPLIDKLLKFLVPRFRDGFKGILDIIGDTVKLIGGVIESLLKIFNGIIDFILGVFTGDWGRAWSGVVQVFDGIVSGLANIFKYPLNLIIDGINLFIRGLNKIKIPDWVPGVGGKGFNIPEIPRLATGGVLNAGQLFIANEAGPELVGNYGRKTAVLNNAQIVDAVSVGVYKAVSSALGSKGGESLNLTVKIGENTITDLIVEDIRRKNRISGETIIEV